MGKSLCEQSVAARKLYDEANSVLGWDLKKLSFEGPEADLTAVALEGPIAALTPVLLAQHLSSGRWRRGASPRTSEGGALATVLSGAFPWNASRDERSHSGSLDKNLQTTFRGALSTEFGWISAISTAR